MRLVLHPDQIQRLADELADARETEIGGVLVGEQLGPDTFRLVDFSIQRSDGTDRQFVCNPSEHEQFLAEFFERTGANYSRFNYLGEWHSHPMFSVEPSPTDLAQMQVLVDEEPESRPFAVLLVTRLNGRGRVEICPVVFRSDFRPEAIDMSVAPRPNDEAAARRCSWVVRLFRPSRLEVVFARLSESALAVHEGTRACDKRADR